MLFCGLWRKLEIGLVLKQSLLGVKKVGMPWLSTLESDSHLVGKRMGCVVVCNRNETVATRVVL